MPTDRAAWHRRDDETEAAWARFETYLYQTPPRSMAALARTAGVKPSAVREMASRHHWRERVEAYDRWLQAEADAVHVGSAAGVSREHAKILRSLREIVAHQILALERAVKTGKVTLGSRALVEALGAEVKLSRLVVGEATERAEVANGVDYSRLSPEELLELARLERKARSAGPVLALVKGDN